MIMFVNIILVRILHFNMSNINSKEIIKMSGLKITAPREMLVELLSESEKPLCYNDIKSNISMDKATFYRTMNSFEEAKIVSAIESNDKKRYFELIREPHSHFLCNICHSLECISTNNTIELAGYTIDSITMRGVCAKCTKKQL